jgi:universal stress protein A
MRTKTIRPSGRNAKPATAKRLASVTLSPVQEPGLRIRSILVPIDFSDASKKALRYAVAFAGQFAGKITLLYVVEPVATPDFAYYPLAMEYEQVMAAGRRELDKVCAKEAVKPRLLQDKLVRNGVAHRVITEVAKELKTDLIVISTHGNTGLKHLMLGSTTERVVRHAPCPVLVVREHENEFAGV